MTHHFTVTCTRDFDHPPAKVFATWLDPAARARFETPEVSGMSHVSYATAQGDNGEILIEHGGAEVGRMFDTIRVLHPGSLAVVHGWGVFGGATAMTMQTTFAVTPNGDGCTFRGTSQIVTLGDTPTEAQVEQGWADMLDRFATVLGDA